MGRARRTHGKMTAAYKILVGVPEERRPLGRPGRRWEDKVKISLRYRM
jgi:hypothetical protein